MTSSRRGSESGVYCSTRMQRILPKLVLLKCDFDDRLRYIRIWIWGDAFSTTLPHCRPPVNLFGSLVNGRDYTRITTSV